LAPYEEITEEHYDMMVETLPDIDFAKIVLYEYDDSTTGSKELACVAGTCEIEIPAVPQTHSGGSAQNEKK
ncbi:MAG: hypothetical protein AAB727_03280, partial [Patescibacteria group bacterium]